MIFIKSLFLLTLVFVCSSVSNSLGNRLGYLFESFSCFLRKACITINFPQRTAFAASHRFCVWLYFHCYLSQGIFKISSLISLIHFFLSSMFFSLCIITFSLISLWLIINFMPLWSEKMLKIISVL